MRKEDCREGDEVEIIDNTNNSCNAIGDIGIITAIGDSTCNVEVDGKNSHSNYTEFDEIKLVEEKTIINFKVGQRVVLVDSWKEDLAGEKGTITRGTYADNMVGILLDCRSESTSCYARRLELIGQRKQTTEVKQMDIEKIDTKNLKIAKADFAKENKNAEVEFAMEKLRIATDMINDFNRQIKSLEERKKPYQETLDLF